MLGALSTPGSITVKLRMIMILQHVHSASSEQCANCYSRGTSARVQLRWLQQSNILFALNRIAKVVIESHDSIVANLICLDHVVQLRGQHGCTPELAVTNSQSEPFCLSSCSCVACHRLDTCRHLKRVVCWGSHCRIDFSKPYRYIA